MPSLPVGASISEIASSLPGQVTLAGVGVCLLGIAIAALAGFTKEREMPEAQKKLAIKEFNFKKGLMVATFSGVMSACFSFALTAGKPHRRRRESGRHFDVVDRTAKTGRGAGGRIHDQFHLVRTAEPQESAPVTNISLRTSNPNTHIMAA